MQFPANSFRYFQFEPSNVLTHFAHYANIRLLHMRI